MVKAASREEVGSLEMWCWLGAVWRPCTAGKMGKWSQNEVSLRLHWRRKDDAEARSCREQTECFGKDESSGKTEGSRERGRPPLIWADCVRRASSAFVGTGELMISTRRTKRRYWGDKMTARGSVSRAKLRCTEFCIVGEGSGKKKGHSKGK